jgi:hypothetical protein
MGRRKIKLPGARQYPKELLINGVNWRVIFVDQIDGKDTLGLCDSETKTIQLVRKMTPKDRLIVFTHEILHAIEYSYALDIPHNVVYSLAEALVETLMVNYK